MLAIEVQLFYKYISVEWLPEGGECNEFSGESVWSVCVDSMYANGVILVTVLSTASVKYLFHYNN